MGRLHGDLKGRTLDYGERILRALEAFPSKSSAWVVGKQLGRAGTSIGANVWEADHAHTEADFAHKISIARKESAETEYWLTLAQRVALLGEDAVATLLNEARELTKILGTIVVRTQERQNKDQ